MAVTVMLLAAGRGLRMMPLTRDIPKPLLRLGNKCLLAHWFDRIAPLAGPRVIVNAAYRAEQIGAFIATESRFPVAISLEPEALETGGALKYAFDQLKTPNDDPILVISADVYCHLDLDAFYHSALAHKSDCHLLLVKNPAHHPLGDFTLDSSANIRPAVAGAKSFTYSGICTVKPSLIAGYDSPSPLFPLRDLFVTAIQTGTATGDLFDGLWCDVGTPERLEQLTHQLAGVL